MFGATAQRSRGAASRPLRDEGAQAGHVPRQGRRRHGRRRATRQDRDVPCRRGFLGDQQASSVNIFSLVAVRLVPRPLRLFSFALVTRSISSVGDLADARWTGEQRRARWLQQAKEACGATAGQGFFSRPVRGNRRPPVAVYRTGLTGYRLKPVKFKIKFKIACVTGSERYTDRFDRLPVGLTGNRSV